MSPTSPTVNRWRVLTGAVLTLLMAGALYSFSVFAGPFSDLRGWDKPDVMMAFGIASALAPIPMIVGGILLDRGYTQALIIVGGLLFGGGHLLAGNATSLALFYVAYGVLAGLGQGLMYSAALSNTLKFFPDKRGLASGLITAGMGAGSVVAAPLGRWMVDRMGVASTFTILGIVFAVVVVSSGVFLIRQCPANYTPQGWTPPAASSRGAARQLGWRQMLATPRFWVLLPTFICGAFFGLMITSNLAPISQDMFGASAATAALFVSLLGLCNMLGRLAWGWISDRITPIVSLMCVFVVAACALVLLGKGSGMAVLVIGVVVLGFAFGGVMSLFPSLTMAAFGPRHQGVNYGIIFSAYAISGVFAPKWAAGIAQGNGGSFSPAFLIAAGIAAVGLVLALVYRTVDRRPPAPEPAGTGTAAS